jgi:hypothetical protein
MGNFLFAVMQAVENSVATGTNQQLSDASTTLVDTNLEQTEYNTWTDKVSDYESDVNKIANKIKNDPKSKSLPTELQAAQAKFQNAETKEQTYTQQADSGTQAMQNQAGQDSSTEQQKIQLEAAINTVSQTLASALAQRY